MLDRAGNFRALTMTRVATACAALSIFVMTTAAGWPQAAAPPPPGIQAPAPSSAQPAQQEKPENPGLISEIEKLWEKSKSMMPTIKSPQETIEDAGESLSRLAKPALMVSGRMGCPVSANGAPDCKAGADKLCQSKGYKEGKSLDTDAAEKCSAKVYLPGHKREPGDCRTENYVTRALCQ
jgi:hypothetical protein